jgi:hypothetical protein
VPPPPPPPPPPSTNYATAEYQRSNGARESEAITAYEAGGTGAGVKVAVIDSGITPNLSEFSGRIDPASQDVAGNAGLLDRDGHGTAVSGVLAANRNDSGMMGVAFEASIISLNVADPASCPDADGCTYWDNDIADAIDIAIDEGAKVINISLGGGDISNSIVQALIRAADAGVVVVMSAGNDGEISPDGFAQQGADMASNGNIIIAGAVDGNGNIASFSNRAGDFGEHYLAALGVSVATINTNGALSSWSGTSISAPVISGAAALLASAFPNLTGAEIVEILFESADDAGAVGNDSVYGHGRLNIARAFQPIGQTALAGTGTPVSTGDNGEASEAMGDAARQALSGAIILDGYSRAFVLDLGRTIQRARAATPLRTSIGQNLRTRGGRIGGTSFTLTMFRKNNGEPVVGLAQTRLSYEEDNRAKMVASSAVTRLSKATAVAFGFSESGRSLQQRLADAAGNAFLVARDPGSRLGFQTRPGTSLGLRHSFNGIGFTVTSEKGAIDRDVARTEARARYSLKSIAADGRVGPAQITLGASRLRERDSLLGGRFAEALFGSGSSSLFVDASASVALADGLSTNFAYRHGWTQLSRTGALVEAGQMTSDAFSIDILKEGLMVGGDQIGFRIAQPLRVRSGGFDMQLPVSYDYRSGAVGYEGRFVNLSPSGREVDFELNYNLALARGRMGANLFLRREPGHIEAAEDDIGGAIRVTWDF